MINPGEGTSDKVAVPASPDHFDSKSCSGDAASPLSQYSTCGESEFERYCSANSAMGTPSLCSTSLGPIHDFNLETEFGSLKSLENFSLEAEFGRSLKLEDTKLSDSCGDWIKEKDGEDSSGVFNGFHGREEGVDVGSRENDLVDAGSEGNDSGFELGFDGREDYEAESDDGSMYGCGSGDESGKQLYVNRNFKSSQNAKVENENPLLINSSVAFGSDDWDDFELETGGALASFTLDKFQDQKQQHFASEGNISCSASLASIRVPIVGCTEIGKDAIEEPASVRPGQSDGVAENVSSCSLLVPTGFQDAAVRQEDGVRDIPSASCQVRSVHQLTNYDAGNSTEPLGFPSSYKLEQEDAGDSFVTSNHVQGTDEATEHLKCCALNEHEPVEGKTSTGLELEDCSTKVKDSSVKSDIIVGNIYNKDLDSQHVEVLDIEADPPADTACQSFACADKSGSDSGEIFEDKKPDSTQIMLESSISKTSSANSSVDYLKDHPAVVKAEDFELNEFYAEIIDEMEEILLDSGQSRGARFPLGNHMLPSQLSLPSRDGGSTASTSGTDDPYPLVTQPLKIDGVEVVGAKQKKGDVSLSERMVGVKEYTVYILRVWSGKDSWVVERRYRDFFTLYRRLKSLFGEQGWSLPSPWYSVEKGSRKVFGNVSPDVVSERSTLIQECLSSIIHSGMFSSPPGALVWFLSPQDSFPGSPPSSAWAPWLALHDRSVGTETVPVLGKTISLVVEIQHYKSTKQILEVQNYTCAGCHKHFDDGMSLMRDLVQTLGWGKPRFCEYTGQLFCSSCHTNDTAVLPARVLHFWDFTQYPVSQLAKSYLDSIYQQPMLCVSAVNPMLSSKVSTLQHVMSLRRRIGTLILYVHCPFRQTINKGLGHRRYLLESNDFFALRDLIDLSKGAFAALPTMLETILGKILEHITEQCLVCCDVGIPCSAREDCSDPSSLIFPFQEGDIESCTSCGSVFHKLCFGKLTSCSCGAHIGVNEDKLPLKASSRILGRTSTTLSVGLLSRLFSKSKPELIDDHKRHDTVIVMGTLPSNSL